MFDICYITICIIVVHHVYAKDFLIYFKTIIIINVQQVSARVSFFVQPARVSNVKLYITLKATLV